MIELIRFKWTPVRVLGAGAVPSIGILYVVLVCVLNIVIKGDKPNKVPKVYWALGERRGPH